MQELNDVKHFQRFLVSDGLQNIPVRHLTIHSQVHEMIGKR